MPAIDLHAPVLGPPGQPCAACGEPLAADQRYCLSCGERRGPPRLDPLAHARGRAPSAGAAPAAGAARRPAPGDGLAPALAAGGGHRHAADARLRGRRPARPPDRRPRRRWPRPAADRWSSWAPAPAAAAPAAAQPTRSQPAPSADASAPDASTADTSTGDTSAPDTSTAARTAPAPADNSTPDSSAPDTSTPDSSSPDQSDTPATGDSSTTPAEAPFKHVWIVALTGHTMDEALADPSPMPYLSGTLRPKGLLLSGYKPALPGGLANLIAMVSGQRPTAEQRGGCPAYDDVDLQARTGCVFAKDVETLPGQLTAAGKTWRAYVEDSDAGQPPDTCRHPAPGGALEPVMARNPYLFFHAIVDTPDCAANTPASRLIPDSEDAESAPSLSLVIPDACHDGADQRCAGPRRPRRGRRVAEGAARPAAGVQGLRGRRPRAGHLRHRARTPPSRWERC